MLGFKKKDSASGASSTDPAKAPPGSTTGAGPGGTKGHATPSRREAEDARKNQLKIPKDPKAAKKAARQRDQEERSRARQGMKNGEERYLPARDRGPARAFARDFVDGRITLAEFFIFIAIAVLALGFIKNQFIQSWVSIGFFAVTALIVVDTVVLLGTLASQQGEGRWRFGAGAALASTVWFFGLGFGARQLAGLFAKPVTWRILEGVIALTMIALSVSLALT